MTAKRPTQNGITPPAVFNLSGSTGLSRDIWQDATTPKTDKPVRLVAHPCRPDYAKRPSLPSGLSSHVVRLSTISR